MKIIDRAKAISQLLVKDQAETGGLLALPLQVLAVEATLGGVKSPAWKIYMRILASNEAQLKRLTAEDPLAGEKYVRETSAYMVANATCGGQTPNRLAEFLDERIDLDVAEQTDPDFAATRLINFQLLEPAPPGGDQPA